MLRKSPVRLDPDDRRHAINHKIKLNDISYHVRFGLSDTGNVNEVFASGSKVGSDMRNILNDACIIISVSVQCGVMIADLKKRLTSGPDDSPDSVIGLIMNLMELEQAEIDRLKSVHGDAFHPTMEIARTHARTLYAEPE